VPAAGVNPAVADRAGGEVGAVEACAANQVAARVDGCDRAVALAEHARLAGRLEPDGEDPVDEERHRVVVRDAGWKVPEQRDVRAVGAQQGVAVGEQRRTDADELGGVEAGQRLAQSGGEQPAAVDQVGFQQVDAGCGLRVDGGAGAGG
jgi:hypothetical protein